MKILNDMHTPSIADMGSLPALSHQGRIVLCLKLLSKTVQLSYALTLLGEPLLNLK